MNTDKDDAVTQLVTSAAQEAMPFKCPKCVKRFTSKAGLNMHNMRVHSKLLGSGYKWKAKRSHNWDSSILERERKARAKKNFPSNDRETRRRKYREQRDRFHALGLDAKGRPFKSAFGRKVSQRMQQAGPVKWTPERLAKFRATMRRKAASKQGFQQPQPNSKKRIQFVYPITEAVPPEPEEKPTSAMRFCPHCGTNIERYL